MAYGRRSACITAVKESYYSKRRYYPTSQPCGVARVI